MTINAIFNPNTAPASEFYVTGGTLSRDAACYVTRQADSDLLDGLRQGAFCYVLTSRQMGKSSLMVRTATRLRQEGIAVAVLDLTAIGQNLTPEQWYDGLLSRVGRQLDLEDELEDYWLDHERLAPLPRFMQALRQVVLQRVPGRVVLFIDEIDAVRSLPFSTDEFFAAIREAYNARSEDPELARLAFGLFGVAAPSDLIRDTRTTPFNIGKRIELKDFTLTEALPLTQGLNAVGDGAALLKRILYWTGGHPYLTQRLCLTVAESAVPMKIEDGRQKTEGAPNANYRTPNTVLYERDVDRVCHDLFLSSRARERDDNLLFVRDRLLRSEVDRASLLDKYGRVLSRRPVADDETDPLVTVLRLSGITRAEQGQLLVRNRIYGEVFDRKWVTANMPDAELRRQHEAFRRGVMRAVAFFGVIVMILMALSIFAMHNAEQARAAERKMQVANLQAMSANRKLEKANATAKEQRKQALDAAARAENSAHNAQLAKQQAEDEKMQADREKQQKVVALKQAQSSNSLAQSETIHAHQQEIAAKLAEASARISAHTAKQQKARAEMSSQRAQRQSYNAVLDSVARGVSVGNTAGASRLLNQFAHSAWPLADLRGFEWYYLDALCRSQTVRFLTGHKDIVRAMVYTPGGEIISASGESERELKFWNARTGKLVYTQAMKQRRVDAMAVSPDGKYLATGEYQEISLWDIATRKEIAWKKTTSPQGPINDNPGLAFSPNGKLLAIGGTAGFLSIRDARTLDVIRQVQVGHADIHTLAFSHDSATVLAGFSDYNGLTATRLVRVSDLHDIGSLIQNPLFAHKNWVESATFSPDGKYIATASKDKSIKIWTWGDTTKPPITLEHHVNAVQCLAFSPDGKRLASGGFDNTVRVWDTSNLEHEVPREVATLRGHSRHVHGLVFSSDGSHLVSAGYDGKIAIWDMTHIEQPVLRGHTNAVNSIACTPDGKLISASADGSVQIWNWQDQKRIATLTTHTSSLHAALSPDGSQLAVAGEDGLLELWNPNTRQKTATMQGTKERFRAITFSQDGRILATAGAGNWPFRPRLWDVATYHELGAVGAHNGWVQSVAFTHDGKTLVSGDGDSDLEWWNVAAYKTIPPKQIFPNPNRDKIHSPHQGNIYCMVVSPDGKTMATGGEEGLIQIWDTASRAVVNTLYGHSGEVFALAFSPDGKTLASGGRDKRIKLWTLAARKEGLIQDVVNLTQDWGEVTALTFTPDGGTLISGHISGAVMLWQARPPTSVLPSTITKTPQKRSGVATR